MQRFFAVGGCAQGFAHYGHIDMNREGTTMRYFCHLNSSFNFDNTNLQLYSLKKAELTVGRFVKHWDASATLNTQIIDNLFVLFLTALKHKRNILL